ncbi:3-methyl-2-oxobutanoate hydroxymethyltransferase [Candidatus Mcinerneyibacteriota bacterium]|nr:3-methyl-2-oxobutanoate hydroxymethyltransferase [Candidatus Mcinerneyibacteriota bacterium]
MEKRLTSQDMIKMKARGERVTALTAYDYSMARAIDRAGVDMILVGDSLGMVVYGEENTLRVTMDQMISHGSAVVRGTSRAFVAVDMPFMSFQVSVEEGIRNAGRLMSATGASAVKFEGSHTELAGRLVECGIPVVGHLGYTPQSVKAFGREIVRGRAMEERERIMDWALKLEEAGITALVLESVPESLGKQISEELRIPVIGIGSGRFCDGEIQVCYDIMGLYPDFTPKHTRIFSQVGRTVTRSVKKYVRAVKERTFPGEENVLRP